MKRRILHILTALVLGAISYQTSLAQCVQLGTPVGQLSPVLKTPISFCPAAAQISSVCDCPAGFVAVGYEGLEGNVYGPMVLSQFKLRCKQLNSNGTLGATVMVTCSNGTSTLGTPDGPVDAAAGQALVGLEIRIGCATDAVIGRSKLLSEIIAGQPNTVNNTMTGIGGTGGAPQAPMYAPNGSVIVGMQTYIEPGPNPAGSAGITAGVAWRYAPIVACPLVCSVNSITVSNISACNNQGTTTPADDTFTANVTVTFTDPPTTGTLNLTGDATTSVPVASLGAGTYTFTGVTMSADGTPISLTATFSAASTCTLTNSNAGTAPASCSIAAVCSITGITTSNISACNNNGTPANAMDDFFTANVTVTFANPPASGTLNLSGSGTASVAVGSLGAGTHTFTGVQMSANGLPISLSAAFSANPACSFSNNNAGTAPANCSPNAPTIPTMSEWGLILFALIIFTMAVVFGTQQQRELAMEGIGGKGHATYRRKMPFDWAVYFKVLPMVYLTFALIFGTAIAFGYELTNADVPGSLLSGLVIAYLVQFVIKSSKSEQ